MGNTVSTGAFHDEGRSLDPHPGSTIESQQGVSQDPGRLSPREAARKAALYRLKKTEEKLGKTKQSKQLRGLYAQTSTLPAANLEQMGNCCSGNADRTPAHKKVKAFQGEGHTLGGTRPAQHIEMQVAEPEVARTRKERMPKGPGRRLTDQGVDEQLTPQEAARRAALERAQKNDQRLGKTNPSERLKNMQAQASDMPTGGMEWRQD
ncbi:hypothetical protein EC988_002070 [Linderina pennispora]|nr:hypothetical protein EC988_002070 [Linderina pennispora]